MKRVLLMVMFVLSLFIMCGCGEENRRGDRHSEQWDQDRHSEQDRSDRYQERNTEPREERHEEPRR
jgi:hypothetical protein